MSPWCQQSSRRSKRFSPSPLVITTTPPTRRLAWSVIISFLLSFLLSRRPPCVLTANAALTPPVVLPNAANARLKKLPAFRIVLDPGHGGSDEGTIFQKKGLRLSEKQITLKLAQQIAARLRAAHFQVTLTRTRDQEVPLAQRTALANQQKAQLFISLHVNSSQHKPTHTTTTTASPWHKWSHLFKHPFKRAGTSDPTQSAGGIETYILNHTSNDPSRRLALLENSFLPQNTEKTPEDADLALILKDLRLDANFNPSRHLACIVQKHLTQASHIPNRGVKQALFHVLLGADMPSILVEAGFLDHPKDRQFLSSARGQSKISQAMVKAIQEYRRLQNQPDRADCKVY